MKMTKTILVAIVACAAVALISMAGTFPAAMRQGDPTDVQAQTTTQLPEIVPGISIDLTIDRIFR